MLEQRNDATDSLRPGYARVRAFTRVWDYITKLRLSEIDQTKLNVVGVNGSTAVECLAALRFLGLVAPDGTVTDKYAALHSGDVQALADIVDSAYSELREICPVPAESREQLETAMGAAYGLKKGRMAMAAAALFEWLCEQTGRQAVAGPAEAPTRTRGSNPLPSRSKQISGTKLLQRVVPVTAPGADSVIFALTITPQTTSAEISMMLNRIEEARRGQVAAKTKENEIVDRKQATT